MVSPSEILDRIGPLNAVAGFDRVEHFLRQPTAHYHEGGGTHRVSVKSVDHAWGTRLMIAQKKGLPPVAGSEHLVASINDLPNDAMLEYAIFADDQQIAAFWFLEETREPVGFIVVERAMMNGLPVPLE